MINLILFFIIFYIFYRWATYSTTSSFPEIKKGSFTVYGYKNGELIYKETFIDSIYLVQPGDKYDKIEIIN